MTSMAKRLGAALFVVLLVSTMFVGTAAATNDTPPNCSTVSYVDADGDGFLDVDSLSKLQCIDSYGKDLSANYELTSDIDASGTRHWTSDKYVGDGFNQIGDSTSDPFKGVFNGNNHTISGLFIDTGADQVGLFGAVAGRVENVGIENVDITGSKDVGGLVGYNSGGTVTNSYVTGSVSAAGDHLGGLVGTNSNGRVSESYAATSVSGKTQTSITRDGTDFAGGLVGRNIFVSSITNSYATGSVTGDDIIGGLVGINRVDDSITNSYATGSVTGDTGVGGFVGSNKGAVSDSYWDKGTTTQSSAFGADSGTTSGLTGFGSVGDTTSAPEMLGINATVRMSNLDFSTVWRPGDSDNAYLDLAWDSSFAGSADAFDALVAGDGTSASPYQIEHVYDLQAIRERVGNGEHFTLADDVDASATSVWFGGNGFEPIGDGTHRFTGTFDGANHTISGLSINQGSTNDVGLFGSVDGGRIENVGVENASITGYNNVGGLVGYNNVGGLVGNNGGTVINSYVTASVNGSGYVGGLVGSNSGTVTNSYVTASANGSGDVGGLVGSNSGTVTKSYATGSVTGSGDYVGGLVGYSDGPVTNSYATSSVTGSGDVGGLVGYNLDTISESYATGSITGSGDVGGLVGESYENVISPSGASVTNSYATGSVTGSGSGGVGGLIGSNSGSITDGYWDAESTGQASSAGSPDSNGLTTAQMQRFAPLVTMDGFSFENPQTWLVTGNYLALAWQDVTELTVDSVEATSPIVAEGESGTIIVTTTESGTNAGEGVTIEVLTNDSLDGFGTGDTKVTDTNGQVSFTFDEPIDGTYSPTFALGDDTSVSATSTVTVDNTAPVADAGQNTTVPEDTQLTLNGSASTDNGQIDSYAWNLSSDGILTGETATTNFETPGNYTATLTVTDAAGNTDTDTLSISVRDTTTPVANVSYSDSDGDEDTVITFNGTASTDNGNIVGYEWDFTNDGSTDATGSTATHTYAEPGTYTVRLRVTDTVNNTDTVTNTITIADVTAPTAEAGSNITTRPNALISFDGTGSSDNVAIDTYAWDVDGNGTADLRGSQPSYTYGTAGSYTVSLTVTDAAGNTDTDTLIVTVDANTTETDSDSDGIPDSVEKTGDIDGDGVPNYRDTDADGDGILDSVEGTGDADNSGIPDYRDPNSDSDTDGIPDTNESTTDTDGDGRPDFRDQDADGDGLTDMTEGTIDTDGDGTRDFRDTDSDGDGIPDSVEGAGDRDGDSTPNYRDTDSDSDGTSDRDEGTDDADGDGIPNYLDDTDDRENALAAVASADGQFVSVGTTVTFNGSQSRSPRNITGYEWNFTGGTAADETTAEATHTFTTPGTHVVTLTVRDDHGMANPATDTVRITVEDTTPPTVVLNGNRTVDEETPIVFNASESTDNVGITGYEWTFGDGSRGTGANPSHTYDEPGSYTVTVTARDAAGGETTKTMQLTVTGPEATSIAGSSALGNVSTGSVSATTLTVRNTGNSPLDLGTASFTGTDTGQFTLARSPSALPTVLPRTAATLTVRYTPTTQQVHNATLTVPTNDTDTGTIELPLSGRGVSSTLMTDTGSQTRSIGSVQTSKSNTTTVRLTNTGTDNETVTATFSGNDIGAFALQNGSTFRLASGASRDVTVTFDPTTFGEQTANLVFTTGDSSTPVSVALAGTGLAPNATVDSTLQFSSIGKGRTTTANVTVTNDGTAPLNVPALSVQGVDAEAFVVETTARPTLAPGEQQSVSVTFAPKRAGQYSGRLVVDTNATTVGTRLNGTALAPRISTSTRNLNYGNVALNSTKTLSVDVTNPSSSPANLTVNGIDVFGIDSSAFRVTNDPTGTVVPGGSRRIDVAFTPVTASDEKQAQLRIHSDASLDSQTDIWMTNTQTVVIIDEISSGQNESTVSIDANDIKANTSLSLNVSRPSTREKSVGVDALNMTVKPDGYFAMNLTHADTASAVGASPFDPGSDRETLQHIRLTHTLPNEEFDNTGLIFRVEKGTLPNGTASDEIRFRRYSNRTWNELSPTLHDETSTHYVYTVETPGFSQFLVTSPTSNTGSPSGGDDTDDESTSDGGPTDDKQPPGSNERTTGVAVTDSPDESTTDNSTRVSVTRAVAGEPVSIDLTNASGTANASSTSEVLKNICMDGISITAARNGNFSLTTETHEITLPVDGRQAVSVTSLPATGRQFLSVTGHRPTGFIEIGHDISDDNITAVTHRFRVRKSYLNATGGQPDSVRLYRNEPTGWNALDTRQTSETAQFYHFVADSPGLSLFAIGTQAPVFEVRNATATATGQTVVVNATIANIGAAQGSYNATLRVDDTVVDTTTATVPANETRPVSVRGQVTPTGNLSVSLSDTAIGTIEVGSVTDDTTANKDVDMSDSVVLVGGILLMILFAVLLVRRHRE